MMRRRAWFAAVAAALLATTPGRDLIGAAAAESGAASPRRTGPRTYVDMLGHSVALAAPPTRIVSLVPSVTELIYALGGQARLVGRTDFCDYPAEAREKPSVGGMVAPNLESIVALKPDLVIGTPDGSLEA